MPPATRRSAVRLSKTWPTRSTCCHGQIEEEDKRGRNAKHPREFFLPQDEPNCGTRERQAEARIKLGGSRSVQEQALLPIPATAPENEVIRWEEFLMP